MKGRELWLLDDGRSYGGGQMIALRIGRYIESGPVGWTVQLFCPRTSELARRWLDVGLDVHDARFPDLRATELPHMAHAVKVLRRHLASATENVIVVGGSLRVQVYAHAAAVSLPRRPAIVQFMTERDSGARRSGAFLLSHFGAIVALGSEAAHAYEAAAPKTPVIKINNFLLPRELSRRPSPRPDVDRPPIIGVLARLIPEKGIVELLEELAVARQTWTKLLIGGNADDPDYLRMIQQRVSSLGLADAVSLLGYVDDLSGFMATVGIIVVPSVGREGQPTVVLDALSHDRPVIVREHVWSADFAGLPVVPYRDASELASLLGTVPRMSVDLEELPRRFGAQQVLDAFEAAADGLRSRRHPKTHSCTSG